MATLGTFERDNLIAGDFPTESQEITIVGPVEFKRGDVVGALTAGGFALVNSTATNGSQTAVGIICDDVTAADGVSVVTTMYIKGEFAQRHLRFGGTDTADTHKRRMTEIGLIVRPTRI